MIDILRKSSVGVSPFTIKCAAEVHVGVDCAICTASKDV